MFWGTTAFETAFEMIGVCGIAGASGLRASVVLQKGRNYGKLTGEAGLREFCRANKQEPCKITQVPYLRSRLISCKKARNVAKHTCTSSVNQHTLGSTVHLMRQQIQRGVWVGLVAAVRTRS